MKSQKSFTTTQAAELMGVSSSKLREMMDEGLFSSFTLPGSKHRRVHASDLSNYMARRGLFRIIGFVEILDPFDPARKCMSHVVEHWEGVRLFAPDYEILSPTVDRIIMVVPHAHTNYRLVTMLIYEGYRIDYCHATGGR